MGKALFEQVFKISCPMCKILNYNILTCFSKGLYKLKLGNIKNELTAKEVK